MRNNKGITLVALIITIIILIILAGISINLVLGENGLFGRALQAREDYARAEQDEQATFNALLAEIDKIGQGGGSGTTPEEPGTPLPDITGSTPAGDKVKKPEGWSNTTEAMSDGAGHAIPLPNGYYYVGGNYENGLVISDKKDDNMNATGTESGNQFVWIPVVGTTEAERKAYFTRTGFTAGSPTGSIDEDYTEPYTEGYTGEQTDYTNMYNSVIKYGGFYIGRYEAGINDDSSGDTSPRTGKTAAEEVVSKAGVWPYNYVPWGVSMADIGDETNPSGAVYLAKNKYTHPNSVVSTLVYGVQWDAMCKYIGAAKANMTHPTSQTTLSKTKSYPNDDETGDVAKNIYDLAGNCIEWTMEEHRDISRVRRGGYYMDAYPVSSRTDGKPINSYNVFAFRLALYISNPES